MSGAATHSVQWAAKLIILPSVVVTSQKAENPMCAKRKNVFNRFISRNNGQPPTLFLPL